MNKTIENLLLLGSAVIGIGIAVTLGEKISNDFTCDVTPHKVEQGDTLWSIAESKCEGHIQRATNILVDVYGTTIQAGWYVYLPANENCELKLVEGQVWENCK